MKVKGDVTLLHWGDRGSLLLACPSEWNSPRPKDD